MAARNARAGSRPDAGRGGSEAGAAHQRATRGEPARAQRPVPSLSRAVDPGPEISVIVPVRNGAGSLAPLLDSLARQTLARPRFEVVVVDNASTDATAEVAAARGARVVHEPVPNRSRARNRGAAAAASRLYAFTDADCVADPHWLEELLRHAALAPLVAGDVRVTTRPRPNAIERFERLWRFGQEAW